VPPTRRRRPRDIAVEVSRIDQHRHSALSNIMMAVPLLQIFIASVRQGRKGEAIARWFEAQARRHARFEIEVVDLKEVNLPPMDEPEHPRLKKYQHDHTKAWSARVSRADAFVIVTPEHNYCSPPALVNAIDYLVHEWAYKPVGFVSYGGVSGGTRSVQMTKLLVTALKMMPMTEAVHLPFFIRQFTPDGAFAPDEAQAKAATAMLDELLRWTNAMTALRA
jgi:NAD(P)H-dependent FMN reductase